jgi:hypothetical protein
MRSMMAGIDVLHREHWCGHLSVALASVLLASIAACAPVDAGQPAPTGASSAPSAALHDRRELPGAGAVAFDPAGVRLAWASGEEARVLVLASGEQSVRPAGSWIADLGFAPDGSLWVVGDEVQRWQGDALACSTHQVEADRLLAVDGEGAVVAGYTHSDGQGMLRHQVWLDQHCQPTQESTLPLPKAIADAEADPGAPLGRASLRPPRPPIDQASIPQPADQPGATPVAVSADGRWWVFDVGGRRSLWKSGAAR